MNSPASPALHPPRSVYSAAYEEGLCAPRPNFPYHNPYSADHAGSAYDWFSGYRDGFREGCFRRHLSFPDCKPLYRLPFPDNQS